MMGTRPMMDVLVDVLIMTDCAAAVYCTHVSSEQSSRKKIRTSGAATLA
jgi:hypothetical protein